MKDATSGSNPVAAHQTVETEDLKSSSVMLQNILNGLLLDCKHVWLGSVQSGHATHII